MNNNLKYSFKGFMLAVLFIAAIKFFSFAYTLYFPIKTPNADTIAKASTPYFFVVNERGKKLFAENCSSCHTIGKTDNYIDLATVQERVPDCNLIYEFVRNSQKVIESGAPYFNQLYKAFNKARMPSFSTLTDDDIDDILIFAKQFHEDVIRKLSSDAH
jgi:mono/diheme cytochrome c family protein